MIGSTQEANSVTVTDDQVKEIRSFALRKYRELDHAHGENHAFRTEKLAEYIAKKEGADVTICRLGGLLHQYHAEGAAEVNSFLKEMDLEDEVREKVVNCVESVGRSTMDRAKFPEAKVVFDADKLQILGPLGVVREISHRIVSEKINFHEAVEETKELQDDVYNRLQTETARKLAEEPHELASRFFETFERWDEPDFDYRD